MARDGRTTGYLNDCKTDLFDLRNVGQVKVANNPLKDRANLRFADVNGESLPRPLIIILFIINISSGDGRADLIWTDKFNGNADVWNNEGEVKDGDDLPLGSKFLWTVLGERYVGSSRGPNMHFPNLGGIGRADMVQVDPTSAHASFFLFRLISSCLKPCALGCIIVVNT